MKGSCLKKLCHRLFLSCLVIRIFHSSDWPRARLSEIDALLYPVPSHTTKHFWKYSKFYNIFVILKPYNTSQQNYLNLSWLMHFVHTFQSIANRFFVRNLHICNISAENCLYNQRTINKILICLVLYTANMLTLLALSMRNLLI